MSTTGNASFTVGCDDLVSASLRVLRVLGEGQKANQEQVNNGREALNILLKNMQANGLALWTYQWIAVPCQSNKYTYTLGPTGADVTCVRPLRLFPGSYIRFTAGGQTYDTPLRIISRVEYAQFGAKGTQGIPNSLYYFPGIDIAGGLTSPSDGYGTLYAYVNPIDASRTIYGNFQRPIYDVDSFGDELDLPVEWLLPLKWSLAAEMADEYEVPEERIMRVEKKSLYYREQMQDWSTEQASVTFEPDMMVLNRGSA